MRQRSLYCARPVLVAAMLWQAWSQGQAWAADEGKPPFLRFIQAQASELRKDHPTPPDNKAAWETARTELRRNLLAAWGGFPENPCPLEPRLLGTIDFAGYRLEKLVFQTRPGIWMTAHAYVPKKEGRLPAVLCVHGHWREAKQAPQVQSRCIGLAKLGYFVLAVDAFGAGERGVGKALGEYHGEMTAATLWPIGLPLSGLQVYENMRAVDYLLTRPEVDGARLGITGASGGGNQSMYAGTWDERFRAVVPVCSVGSYEAYLGAACCMCEVVPGALRFASEGDILALAAPRGLMVISATKDAYQFSVGEARRSLAYASPVFGHYGQPQQARQVVIESPHDYNRPMREAMYGFMAQQLKGEGDGSPIVEPDLQTAEPESIRCFPSESRPDDWITLPQFAAAEARRLLTARTEATSAAAAKQQQQAALARLRSVLLTGAPEQAAPLELTAKEISPGKTRWTYAAEAGIQLQAEVQLAPEKPSRVAIVLALDADRRPEAEATAAALLAQGVHVILPELRATGSSSYASDTVGHAPDHNTAEWSLWIGRPLLGQWVLDVRRTLDAARDAGLSDRDAVVVGIGTAGTVALCSAALDERIAAVATVGALTSYVSDVPYRKQRLGLMAPGILRDVGDIPHLAALAAPRRVVIAGGVRGAGQTCDASELQTAYEAARRTFAWEQAKESFVVTERADPASLAAKVLGK